MSGAESYDTFRTLLPFDNLLRIMAEAIGIVAGGVSIAQLTGDVAKSIMRLKTLWDQVRDAPEEISYMMKDLEAVNLLLADMEHTPARSHHSVTEDRVLRRSLALCREATQELSQVVDTLCSETSSAKRLWRTRSAVKFVLQKEQIKRLKSRIKSSITLLSLSHQSYTRSNRPLSILIGIKYAGLD